MNGKKKQNKYPKVPRKYRIEYIGKPEDRQEKNKQFLELRIRIWHNLGLWWDEKGRYFLKTIFKTIFIIGIIAFFVWGIISDEPISTSIDTNILERNFPALQEPKTVTFQWEYKNETYTITETLYETVFEYYNLAPKKYICSEGYCPNGWEEDYVKMFLKKGEDDNTISRIASDIKTVGQRSKLNDDQIVELTIAFVQSIPYDYAKAKIAEPLPRYPYEVLYDGKGICSGKSFLAVLLLREMDYGVALFHFDSEEHIAPAVKCPKEYSSYNSGYCFAEVTDLEFRIGEIPRMDIDSGKPETKTIIELFSEGKKNELAGSELKNVEIYEIADGDIYQGVIKTAQTIQRIEALEKELNKLEDIINLLENEVKQLEISAGYYDQQVEIAYRKHEILGDYASYNKYKWLYSQYESVYAEYEFKLKEYNGKINKYNNVVYEYNVFIEDFYK